MKKTMRDIFDEAKANEIEDLVNRNAAADVPADTLSAIKNKVYAKTGMTGSKKKPIRFRWQSYVAAAACLCIVVGVAFGSGVLRFPNAEPDDDIVEPDIAYYALNDLLNREDFAVIIWGSGTSEGDIPIVKDPDLSVGGDDNDPLPDDCVPVPDDEIWTEWNGIKISVTLHEMLQDLNESDLIAIGVDSWTDPALIYDDYVELRDYIYNGETYYEILTRLEQAEELQDMLVRLKKFSSHFEELCDEEKEAYWEELYAVATDEIISKYFQGAGKNDGKFDTTAISNDLAVSETEVLQLRNDLAACRSEYKAKYNAVPDLSKMMNKGYYVVGNNDAFAVILSVGQLTQFGEDIKEVYGAEAVDTMMLRLATQSELGVEIIPDDIPIGEVEEELIPDDIIDEPAGDG